MSQETFDKLFAWFSVLFPYFLGIITGFVFGYQHAKKKLKVKKLEAKIKNKLPEFLKVGEEVFYDDDLVRITHLDDCRISFKAVHKEWSCGNIPLYEYHWSYPALTNIQRLKPKL